MPSVATSLETGELSFGREDVRGYAAWPRGAHPLPGGRVSVPEASAGARLPVNLSHFAMAASLG